MAEFVVPYGSDFGFFLRGASSLDIATGERVVLDGSATITYRVQTPDHVDLADYVWPEVMEYLAGSQGDFLGVLRDSLPWTPNRTYRLIVEADAGTDQHRVWDIPVHVMAAAKLS